MPGKKMMGYQSGGEVPEAEPTKAGKGKINPKRKKFLKEMEAGNKKVGADIKARDKKAKAKAAMNNTSAPKPPTPVQAGIGAMAVQSPTAGGGMGMPPKKPMGMPGMKKGGKVKKYKSGGKVRGAGIAKKGVKKCKYR